jgi:hypothetical protein
LSPCKDENNLLVQNYSNQFKNSYRIQRILVLTSCLAGLSCDVDDIAFTEPYTFIASRRSEVMVLGGKMKVKRRIRIMADR